ncbi:MAG: hypothetical protein AAB602_03200 [Patescibacteria group bacterium]
MNKLTQFFKSYSVAGFLWGSIINLIFIFLPYFIIGESRLIGEYLEGTFFSNFILALPYLIFGYLFLAMFFYLKKVERNQYLIGFLFYCVGFFIVIALVYYIAYRVLSGWVFF